ncbi:alpha/beta hydrolase [bacterium]|nr:alpha/beta hydrolase [bacterium]
MRYTNVIFCLASLFLACELDPFLFDSKSSDHYELPGNTIPMELIQKVSFESAGNMLYGIWVASNGRRPGLTLLYCHGNKNGIDEYWDRVQFLHEIGFNLFIFDYRGYGKSEGESSEKGLHEDGTAALNYIRNHNQVTADSLILYGYSLGNVVSIYLAAEQIDPLCLFAESPFASSASLAQGSSGLALPHRWLTKGTYDNSERVKNIRTSFCLFHGESDDFVRWKDNGRVVWENAPEPKILYLIKEANHKDIPQTLGISEYQDIISEHIASAIHN